MNHTTLLDASAVLAFLQGEPGEALVKQALQTDHCLISAANQAEVIAKALDRGLDSETIQSILANLNYVVIDLTADDGAQAGWLREKTRAIGLSLGDRLCMATALRLKATVLTADRPWLAVAAELSLSIACIRPDSH